jgi:DNA repair exonuclease SbcCD ATPase subunit
MAFTRKFLSALGIEQDKIDEIIQAHTEVTDALKEERDKYKEDAGKLPEIEKQLNELKEQVTGEDPYKEKLEKLQKEYDDFKADVEAKATTAKKEKAFRTLLKEIGIQEKRIDSVMKISKENISKIELDDDGKIKDGDKLKESLKEEWSDFIATMKTDGVNSANPPANTGKTTMTKEEIRKIEDPIARQKAMLENPSLFGLPED